MAAAGPKPVPRLPVGAPLPARDAELHGELTAVLAGFDRLWHDLDFVGLAGLWDAEEGTPVYIGDEYPAPVVGWQELARHFGKAGGRIHEAAVRSTLLDAHRVASDLAVAVFLMDWELVAVESPERHIGQRWVTALLRRRDDGGWRFLHHAESPAYDVHPAVFQPGV